MACSGCAKRRELIRKKALALKHGFVAVVDSIKGSEGVDRQQAESNRTRKVAK